MAAVGPEPRQLVGSLPELIAKIFEYLTPEDRVTASQVNEQWRLASQAYHKRRMHLRMINLLIRGTEVEVSEGRHVEPLNMLNNRYPTPDEPIHLAFKHTWTGQADQDGRYYRNKCSPVAIVTALEQPWVSRVICLKMHCCFTIADWSTIKIGILNKLTNLLWMEVHFLGNIDTVTPLCFTEFANQFRPAEGANDQVRSETLRSIEFWFEPFRLDAQRPLPGFYDQIIRDIFRICPNLTVFEQQGIYGYREKVWLCRSTDRNNVMAEPSPTWVAGIGAVEDGVNLTPGFSQFLSLMLTLVPIRKLCTATRANLLTFLDGELQPITSNLESLCLYSWISRQMPPLSALIPQPMFTNLTQLFWSYETFTVMNLWRNAPVNVEGLPFPNLQRLHLYRKRHRNVPEDNFTIDDWIRTSLNRMAPNLQRLTINAFNYRSEPFTAETDWKDCYKVLGIVQSFGNVENLLLINNQEPMDVDWTNLANVDQVAACLQGLRTVRLVLKDPGLLLRYAQNFEEVEARPESTIQELEIQLAYSRPTYGEPMDIWRTYGPQLVDLNQLMEMNDQYCLDKMDGPPIWM